MAEMEEPNKRSKEGEQETIAVVLDLAKGFGRVSFEDIAGVVWLLRAPEASTV